MHKNNHRVAVVGAGLMGVGIAACLAVAGHPVRLHDASADQCANAGRLLREVLDEMLSADILDEAGRESALARVEIVDELAALAGSDIVYEAVVEQLAVKQRLYAHLERVIAPDTPIASNTSGLLPDALCAGMFHPERFIVAHFWHPPHLIPLVELVPAACSSAQACATVREHLDAAGFETVLLSKAVPGFIGNRIQFAVLREALHLVDSGVADAPTIDKVVTSCLGRRYARFGPLEAADLGGLHTFLDIGRHLLPQLAQGDSGLALLRTMVEQGHKGAQAGQGFYAWTEARRQSVRDRRRRMLAGSRQRKPLGNGGGDGT